MSTEYFSPPFIFMMGVIGLFAGHLLNIVIHRLPKMMEKEWADQCAELCAQSGGSCKGEEVESSGQEESSGIFARSRYHSCGHTLTFSEKIPLLFWILLRGRCSACKTPISRRYLFVEVLTAFLSVGCAAAFGETFLLVGALIFVWSLIALTFIDLDTFLLPDSITLPLVWIGLLMSLMGGFTDIQSSVIGAMAGYLSLWSVYWVFKLATGKEGMGYGDFKLLGAIGAFLGWQMLPAVILLSSVVGLCVALFLMVLKSHGRDTPIPFGPYLAAAGALALFFGETINRDILGFYF